KPRHLRPHRAVTTCTRADPSSSRPNTTTVASEAMNDEPIAAKPRRISAQPITTRKTQISRRLSRSLSGARPRPTGDPAFMFVHPFTQATDVHSLVWNTEPPRSEAGIAGQ